VVDAIDGMYEKTALILACVNHGVPIVTCGGAAGRSDPTKIVTGDLTEVQEDRLLFKCRKELRQGTFEICQRKNIFRDKIIFS